MPLHKTLKDCKQCGHRVDAAVMVCPKCKTVFEDLPQQPESSTQAIDSELSPAEILARMEQKKAASDAASANSSVAGAEGGGAEGTVAAPQATMSQVQVDAISKEKLEFARRWKELTGKKDDGKK